MDLWGHGVGFKTSLLEISICDDLEQRQKRSSR